MISLFYDMFRLVTGLYVTVIIIMTILGCLRIYHLLLYASCAKLSTFLILITSRNSRSLELSIFILFLCAFMFLNLR